MLAVIKTINVSTWMFFALTIAAVVTFFVSTYFRGQIRTRIGSYSILAMLVAGVLLIASLAKDLSLTKADIIGVIGLVLTIALTFFTGKYIESLRRIRVGIVIPSMRPFHKEVRAGLLQHLEKNKYEIIDPYQTESDSEEDLSQFMPTLQKVLARRSDILVICSPTVDLANTPHLIDECRRHTRRGGHVFFIESTPSKEVLDSLRFVTTVISDTSQSAALQIVYLKNRWNSLSKEDQESGRVLVIPGPAHSRPAKERLNTLLSLLGEIPYEVVESLTWTTDEAKSLTLDRINNSNKFRFICCGNDDMAIGSALACYESRTSDIEIIGHDGLDSTIISIRDPFNPISATIRIPPKAYGVRVAALVNHLSPRWGLIVPLIGPWWYRNIKPTSAVLPITNANLVVNHNASFVSGS